MAIGYLDIADYYETEILSGRLKMNDRLPSTTELAKQFDVAPLTIQRSLKRLATKGLVTRKPRTGTLVCGANHQIDRIAVAFGADPFEMESPYFRLILKSLVKYGKDIGITIQPFFDLDNRMTHHFLNDLEEKLTSGSINCVVTLCGNKVIDDWLRSFPGVSWVQIPGGDIFDTAYHASSYLLGKGYRNILTLSRFLKDRNDAGKIPELEGVQKAFNEYQVPFKGHEPAYCGQLERDGYEYTKTFLERHDKPDAILVMHDVICRGVITALLEKGLKIPSDLALVTHANKGADIVAPVRLTRFQADPDMLAKAVLDYIQNETLKPGQNVIRKIFPEVLIEGESA